MPDLGALDLQDQNVVVVVVGSQTRLTWRRDVGVDLYREVQLDLDRAGQRPDRAHVLLNAVQHDRVAVGEVVADADKIEAAISKPVVVGALFVSSLYQPHRRWLAAKQLQELVNRRRPGQESIEVARAASLDVVMGLAPISRQERSRRRAVASNQASENSTSTPDKRCSHQSCSPPSSPRRPGRRSRCPAASAS